MQLGEDRHLEKCAVASEKPADYEFGAAAMSLATMFVLNRGVLPTGGAVTVPIAFRLDQRPAGSVAGLIAPSSSPSGQTGSPFSKTPTGKDMVRYYPSRAMNLGKEGRVILDCSVTVQNTLTDCSIVSETPLGLGFAAAALKLSALFLMKPSSNNSPGAHTTIPINFLLSADSHGPERLVTSSPQQPRWAHQPTADDIERARPAAFSGSGAVTMRCHIKSGRSPSPAELGKLFGCVVVQEAPAKSGFSKGAESLVPLFQFDAATLGSATMSSTIDINLAWAAKPIG